MFNELCWYLNVAKLSLVAATLRRIVAAATPTKMGEYTNPANVGYKGWIESPIGVVAFVKNDGALQWVW